MADRRYLTPELAVTAAGATLSLMLPRRFTFVSGWEVAQTPPAPGTRATSRTPDCRMARRDAQHDGYRTSGPAMRLRRRRSR